MVHSTAASTGDLRTFRHGETYSGEESAPLRERLVGD